MYHSYYVSGLSFFGLIGKVFFTLWWEDDPLPPLNHFNSQFHGFMESGPNYMKDTEEYYPMYPVNSSQPALATYNVQVNQLLKPPPALRFFSVRDTLKVYFYLNSELYIFEFIFKTNLISTFEVLHIKNFPIKL